MINSMRDAAHTIVTFMQSKVDYNLILSPLPVLDSAILAFPDLFVNLRGVSSWFSSFFLKSGFEVDLPRLNVYLFLANQDLRSTSRP